MAFSRLLSVLVFALVCLAITVSTGEGAKNKQLACFPGESAISTEAQAVRTECGGTFEVSKTGIASYNFKSLLLDKTQLRYTLMELDPLEGSLGEGEMRLSVSGTFLQGGRTEPTCQTKRRVSLTFGRTAAIEFHPKARLYADDTSYSPAQYMAFTGASPALGKYNEWGASQAAASKTADVAGAHAEDCSRKVVSSNGSKRRRKKKTPTELRVAVKCKSAPGKRPNKSSCAIRMRVTFVFGGGLNVTLPADATNPKYAAQQLVTQQSYNCGVLAFNDTLNVLNTLQLNGEQSTVVDTQVCAPPERSNPSGDTIAAGAEWDEAALAKAARFSRYASAFHGCQPGQEYAPGQTHT